MQLLLKISNGFYISDRVEPDRQLSWQQFRYCSEEFIVGYGEGLPGRVWASQTPEWIVDVSMESETYFLRHQIAKAFGVRAAFNMPINTSEVSAIAVFFKPEADDPNVPLMATTETLFRQLLIEC